MPVGKIRAKNYRGEWEEYTPEGILSLAASDPWFPWPYGMLHAIINPVERPKHGYSVTTLEQGCVRCVVIQAREWYTLNLNRNWKRFRGTDAHQTMEQHAPPNSLHEVRFFATLDGETVHGQVDLLHLHEEAQEFTVQDYKFPDEVPNWDRVWSDHESQVNFYRWLVNHYETVDSWVPDDLRNWAARSVGVVYIGQKGPKPLECRRQVEIATQPGAKNPTKKVKVPHIWNDEEVEAHFIPRIRRLKAAFEQYDRDGTLPDYPEGFDAFSVGSLHTYSDTVDECVRRWKEGK